MVTQVNRDELANWLQHLQDSICNTLEIADGSAKFKEEVWQREEGGGGRSRIIENGAVFEKGGVNFSAVHGITPSFLITEKEHSSLSDDKKATAEQTTFYATGISIVLHPVNPMVPIIHMNIRYFEMSNGVKWLGGGIDLTPHYINTEDAQLFHQQLKNTCDKHSLNYYPKFKKWADDYFYINHRKETRGVGGIFFDRLYENDNLNFIQNIQFWKDIGQLFAPIYTKLIERNRDKNYTAENKKWQLLRRGRYVEFNLVYDKGTRFGLETNGRIESILMSLPTTASWLYNYSPNKDSQEEFTQNHLKKGINWLSIEQTP